MAERMDADESTRPSRIKQTRALQEALIGKITEPEAHQYLTEADWLPDYAVDVALSQNDKPVLQSLSQDDILRDLNTKFDGKTETRLFACGPDDRTWWRRVPSRKPVSKCRRCQTKYDAIPRNQEWGWCRYVCECGHEFTGFGTKGVESPCYQCGSKCCPEKVFPSNRHHRRQTDRPRNTRKTHSCSATNCCNRAGGHNRGECPHPKSRKKRVVIPSTVHISTGSTVATFLSQGSAEEFETDLSDIGEED